MPDVAALSVKIDADTTGLESGIARANQQVGGLGSTIQTALGAAAVGAVAGLGAAFVGSVKSAADFEKQMSAVGAVAGANAQQMEQLTSAALQLGKDTSFSASEAAKGIEELVKAGVAIEDVIGGGARAALDLAAAGAISVGDAAEIASNAMNVFNLNGADMAHVADVIAGAANASAIGVNDYKFSLSAAGAVAATVGLSFEDLSTAIALMGNAGIKGSDAGTSLKTMLLNLQPSTDKQAALFKDLGLTTTNVEQAYKSLVARGIQPAGQEFTDIAAAMQEHLGLSRDVGEWTAKDRKAWEAYSVQIGLTSSAFFDASGQVKSLADISEVLRDKLGEMTKAQQLATLEALFGADAVRAGAVLLEAGAEGATKMAEAMGKVTAQSVANERLNNLWGSVEKLKGSLETAAIILGGQFTPALKRMADGATDAVNIVIDALEQIPDAIETVRQVFAGEWAPDSSIRPFTNAVGEAAIMVRDTFGPAITTVGAILQQLIGWFQANMAPIATFVAAFTGVIATAGLVAAAISAVIAVLGFLLSPLGLVAVAVATLAVAWQTNFLGIQDATAALWAILQPIFAGMVDWLGARIPPVLEWISGTGWPALVTAGQAVADFTTGMLIPSLTQLVDWFGPKLQPVVTWLSGTGWPALTAATTEVHRVGLLVIQFVQALWVELEKRGIVEAATKAFTDLHAILQPVFNVLALIVGVAAQVIGFFADLAAKGLESGKGVKFVADQIERFFRPIADGLASLRQLIDLLRDLGSIQLPNLGSLWGGGGSSGAQTLSWRGAGAANPNASQADVEQWAYQQAKARGWSDKDARELVSLINGEGAGQGARALGDSGRSFGPMQLFTGGGLGNAALDAGINVRDPSTWQQQVLFGMDTIEREGAGQWTVARNRGLLRTPPVRVPTTSVSASALGNIAVTQAQWGAGVGMTPAEAAAACGPYAAYLFAQATGRTPNPQEAEKLARAAGWTEAGMGGTGNFMRLLGSLGVRAVQTATGGMSAADITQMAANAGPLTAFSTPGHYFASTGFDPSSGKFNVGATGTFAGGKEWMTVQEMSALMGPIQDIITLAGQMGSAFEGAGQQVIASWTDMTGQVVTTTTATTAQVATDTAAMATAVVEQTNLMTSGALTSVTALGDGTLTTVHSMAGDSIATVTDMTGQVTSQYATLSNGAQITMGDMAAGVLTSTTSMGEGMVTIVQDAAGNYIATVTDLHGNVTSQYTQLAGEVTASSSQMSSEVTGTVSSMASSTRKSFDSIRPPAEAAIEVMEAVGRVKIPAPNVSAVITAMHKIEDAADDAREAVSSVTGKGGDKGGDPDRKNNPFAKRASGGPVDAFTPYLVGEQGPELIVPSQDGYVLDADRTAGALGRAGATYNFYGVLPAEMLREARRAQEKDELMYLMRP